jgi:hypothetical protein
MTLKGRLAKAKEIRQSIREVETAKWNKEHAAREADIKKQAEKLADELGVSIETAVRYIKAHKVGELRAQKIQKFKEKAVKVGQTLHEYGEKAAAAQTKSQKGRKSDFDEMSAFFGTGNKPRKRKKRKAIKTKSSTRGKSKRGKKRSSVKEPREIRILLG